MNITQENVNEFFLRYKNYVDNDNKLKNIDINIKHLLYVIIPAFIIKYGIENENIIFKCFSNTNIILSDNNDKNIMAYYTRELSKDSSKEYEAYLTKEYVVINNKNDLIYINMIDSIIHEFNHAVNSINNEIMFDERLVKLRTGLSFVEYEKTNLNVAINKDNSYILEEIINTKQTEDIFDIILSFSKYNINDTEISNSIQTIRREIGDNKYQSDAYFFQSYICKQLMDNKTFIPTIEKLRLKGEVLDVENWFDNIIGEKDQYNRMIDLLLEIQELEKKYSTASFFKKSLIKKVRIKSNELMDIIERFNNSCVYK